MLSRGQAEFRRWGLDFFELVEAAQPAGAGQALVVHAGAVADFTGAVGAGAAARAFLEPFGALGGRHVKGFGELPLVAGVEAEGFAKDAAKGTGAFFDGECIGDQVTDSVACGGLRQAIVGLECVLGVVGAEALIEQIFIGVVVTRVGGHFDTVMVVIPSTEPIFVGGQALRVGVDLIEQILKARRVFDAGDLDAAATEESAAGGLEGQTAELGGFGLLIADVSFALELGGKLAGHDLPRTEPVKDGDDFLGADKTKTGNDGNGIVALLAVPEQLLDLLHVPACFGDEEVGTGFDLAGHFVVLQKGVCNVVLEGVYGGRKGQALHVQLLEHEGAVEVGSGMASEVAFERRGLGETGDEQQIGDFGRLKPGDELAEILGTEPRSGDGGHDRELFTLPLETGEGIDEAVALGFGLEAAGEDEAVDALVGGDTADDLGNGEHTELEGLVGIRAHDL